jgi:hypothetical protein
MRLQTAMIKRERGVIEAATGADMIKLFPTTACPVWQDALYYLRLFIRAVLAESSYYLGILS